MRPNLLKIALVAGTLVFCHAARAGLQIDPELPEYRKTGDVSGSLISIGSDTLANLMALWGEEFKRIYPGIDLQVQAAGSSTTPPALTEGTSHLGPMSRKMKPGEIAAFEKKHNYKPFAVAVAIDALAVYVHKDNPLAGLSIQQVDAIFSAERRCGYPQDLMIWGQLGLEPPWAALPIQLYGRNSASGTYGYFKQKALCKGDFKDTVNEQPGSASVVQSITNTRNGIGYSGIGYRTSGVRAVPVSSGEEEVNLIEPTPENAISGNYPLSRYLYIYVNKHPHEPLIPQVREFLSMVLSGTGQLVVIKDGYIPLSAAKARLQLDYLAEGL